MLDNRLKLNLQFFAEGDDDYFEDGEFDEDKFDEDFEAEFEDESTETESPSDEEVEDPEESDDSGETPPSDEDTDPEDGAEDEQEEEQSTQEPPQDEKQKEAFARLRKEAEANKKYASIIENIAQQNGTTPDKVVEMFERRKLENEAKQQNVPVEYLERQKELENQVNHLSQENFATKFNREVEQAKSKYELNEDQIQETIDFIRDNGYVNERNENVIPFEDAYFLANKDSILEKTKKESQQQYLEQKRSKQKKATVPDKGGTPPAASDEPSEEDILKEAFENGWAF